MLKWLQSRPRAAEAWARQYQELRKRKQDPNYKLAYATFTEFYSHVRELARDDEARTNRSQQVAGRPK